MEDRGPAPRGVMKTPVEHTYEAAVARASESGATHAEAHNVGLLTVERAADLDAAGISRNAFRGLGLDVLLVEPASRPAAKARRCSAGRSLAVALAVVARLSAVVVGLVALFRRPFIACREPAATGYDAELCRLACRAARQTSHGFHASMRAATAAVRATHGLDTRDLGRIADRAYEARNVALRVPQGWSSMTDQELEELDARGWLAFASAALSGR